MFNAESSNMAQARLFIGLISGTSADGIDCALISDDGGRPQIIDTLAVPFASSMQHTLRDILREPAQLTAAAMGRLDALLGDSFAAAANALLQQAGVTPEQITAIGSHGQTVFHAADQSPPFTLQIGDAARIARQTGITVINDFRRADLAVGGQGAPLAPLLHQQWFDASDACYAVLNLGGIANLTLLQPGQSVLGYDTGPANVLMDVWADWCGAGTCDKNGRMAAAGDSDAALLSRMLDEDYFQLPVPKSTGRELFNAHWLTRMLETDAGQANALEAERQNDIMSTLCDLTVISIVDSLKRHPATPVTLALCGGGAHNPELARRLAALLPDTRVVSSAAIGIDPDFVEATLFAWLAARRHDEHCLDTRSITGASHRILAGCVHQPPVPDDTRDAS